MNRAGSWREQSYRGFGVDGDEAGNFGGRMKADGIVPVNERRKAAMEAVSAGERLRPDSYSPMWRMAASSACTLPSWK